MSKFRIVTLSCFGLLLLAGGLAFLLWSNLPNTSKVRIQLLIDPDAKPVKTVYKVTSANTALEKLSEQKYPPVQRGTPILSGCVALSARIEKLIITHSDKIQGSEYCRFRDVANNDTLEVVVFTLEGQCFDKKMPKGSCGNNHSRYMTGISNGNPLAPILVGSKVDFSASTVDIVQREIIVSGAFHQDGDGLCCPSKKGSRKYIIDGNSFKEVTP